MRTLLPVSLLFLAATGALAVASSSRLRTGSWGGLHVSLQVTSQGGTVELDCARGTLDEALVLDARGRFDVKGHYVREHGGPVRSDEEENGRPARYRGTVNGDALTLEIVPEGGPTLEPFELTFGGKPKIMKCR